jgi:hypothetical protein
MAEEEPTPTPTEAAVAAPPAENGGAPKENGKRNFKKQDDVPVEDLYDLSKPIPRVSSRTNDSKIVLREHT